MGCCWARANTAEVDLDWAIQVQAFLPVLRPRLGIPVVLSSQPAIPPPPVPASHGTPGLAVAWRCGSATVAVPWGALPMGTTSHRLATGKPRPSHQQANDQLTSPSSQGAGNRALRPARAVPLGPKGKATSAQAVGRGGLGERRSGQVPRHPSQSRPGQGLLDAHFLLPPNSGTLPETEMRPRGKRRAQIAGAGSERHFRVGR